jgi:UDP-N-acetylmuramoylalanine--D-glutamate ligase
VGIYSGVRYINSSIDSSPKRTAATLSTFSERVILILGGRSKGLDFGELVPALREKTKFIILTGECGKKIKEILDYEVKSGRFGVPYRYEPDFYDAIDYAISKAKAGDTVLLSPASTSYDKFNNFEERGDAFKRYIKKRTEK